MLSEKRQDWQLVLVGTGIDYQEVRAYADTLGLPENLLRWTGELTPREVAEELHRADAFVLSSRYETYGVVLAEAAAAGLLILSTPVGIAEETADLIVPPQNDQAMAEAMGHMLDHHNEYNRAAIRQAGKKYSYEAVGKQLVSVYEQCITR